MKQPKITIHQQTSQRFHLNTLVLLPLHHKIITPSPVQLKKEKHLTFGDDITVVKKDTYNRLLFQNVNSLEMSMQHILEKTCDGINNYEIDIAYLAEINTRWGHNLGESTLRNTTKRY